MLGVDKSLPFKPVRIAVLTVSDTRTVENDRSGDLLVARMEQDGHILAARQIIIDDAAKIVQVLNQWIDDPGN